VTPLPVFPLAAPTAAQPETALAAADELELATLLDELAATDELELDALLVWLLAEELAEDTALEAVDEILEEVDDAALPPEPPPPQANKALVSKTRLRDFPVRAKGITGFSVNDNIPRSINFVFRQIKSKRRLLPGYSQI